MTSVETKLPRIDLHRLAEERSIAYHSEIASRLEGEPALLDAARGRVAEWLREGPVHSSYAEAWREILGLPLERLRAALVAPNERMRALRQCSPFAGAIDPRRRWRIRKDVLARASGR